MVVVVSLCWGKTTELKVFLIPGVQEADTDDNQGTLDFEEFCSFYKMMSTRRDLYLLMLTYSNHKDHLDTDDLARFLETEEKVLAVHFSYSVSTKTLTLTLKSYSTDLSLHSYDIVRLTIILRLR